MNINSVLTIDNSNLEKIFFTSKWEKFKIKIEHELTEGQTILNLFIDKNMFTLNYDKDKFNKEIT